MSKALENEIDKLFDLRQELEKEELILRKKKEAYNKQFEKILDKFKKSELESVATAKARFSLVRSQVFNVTDMKKFRAYVLRNKALDLFKQSISTTAVKERLEAGKKIPGIEPFTRITARLTKIKSKS